MATGFPTKANWVSGDILTAAQMDDLAGTVNALSNAAATSGSVLVSNVAGTSFAYQPLQAAGKNAVINGGMDIWQRGTSIAIGGNNAAYASDRWYIATFTNAASTISRQPTSDTTNLPNIQYCARVQRNSGQTGTGNIISQSIETINSIPFAGKQVTLSFYARAGANYSPTSNALTVVLYSGTGTDQNINGGFTGQASPIATTATLTTTWQRFSFTATVATTATELAPYFSAGSIGTAGANDYFEITGVQLELGSTATTFSRAGGSIGGELALCQRYYFRESGTTGQVTTGFGVAYSTTNFYSAFKPKVTMRIVPTLDSYSSLQASNGISTLAVSSAVIWTNSTVDSPSILCTTAGTFTAGTAWSLAFSGTGYVGFSAEL